MKLEKGLVKGSKYSFNRGIKYDFPFMNVRKVPKEMLKTEGEARDFQPSRVTLQMSMNEKKKNHV